MREFILKIQVDETTGQFKVDTSNSGLSALEVLGALSFEKQEVLKGLTLTTTETTAPQE